MTKVTSILNPVERFLLKPFRCANNTKAMQNTANKASRGDMYEKVLATTTIGSIVLKDLIGCGMYVYQSVNNEKIPKEKRSFVAALDLTNGLLMIAAQLGIFFAFKKMKLADNMFDKIYKKVFSDDNVKQMATAIRAKGKKIEIEGDTSTQNIEKVIKNCAKDSKKIFSSLVDIAAATILAKRVIVPFIATPLAGIAREKIFDKNKANSKDNTDATNLNGTNNLTDEAIKKIVALPESTTNSEPEFKGNLLEHYKANHK